ncbi:MAG TPA: thioredoxin domain-containing protein [Trebonia sp.]|nr:thioredoxin domain-containing protein [Trebonia sp.]
MPNRLSASTSPYLLQHQDNPVDWWPWGDEAFAEAARRDVPVIVSIGYAACHWCHVMAHESFEDETTAAIVNASMVAIKVDREERPDVDAVYMSATQAMTGQGGWPMTVFMTPDGDPFLCGTYYPRARFVELVRAVADAWKRNKAQIQTESVRIRQSLAQNAAAMAGLGEAGGELNLGEVTATAVAGLEQSFDRKHAGFGGAPKFPPSMVLEFLLRYDERTGQWPAQSMAEATCEAMARGGMYDQLGGGFARYSVDARWTVPHFEKMLYDNALLAGVYTHLWRRAGQRRGQDGAPLARRVAEETGEFMLRELRTPEGGLAASLDADSDGSEGAFYVWTPAQLREVLGPDDGDFAIGAFGVTEAGTFDRGASVLQRLSEPAERERFDTIRGILLAAREGRTRPARDDKVVAAWNGLAIGALAEAGVLFDRADFLAAAKEAAGLLVSVHYRAPKKSSPVVGTARILRTSRDGKAGLSAGLLEDYACVAAGLLKLSGVTGEDSWTTVAGELLDTVLTAFADGKGGFYDTADDGEPLIFRPADPTDNATPSGTFAAADSLLSYAALTGEERYRAAAAAALAALPPIAAKYPRAGGMGLAVAEALLSGPAEIAIVGPDDDPRTADLLRAGLHVAPPGAVFALGQGSGDSAIPLLAGRPLVSGAPAAYVCRDFTCQAPVTAPSALRETLRRA